MSKRTCIYTGKEAERMDKVLPKKGGDEVHNWANSAPCSAEYKEIKRNRDPNRLEIKANRLFKEIELTKIELQFLENELFNIQNQIVKKEGLDKSKKEEKPKKKKKSKKEKEIEMSYKEKEILELDIKEAISKTTNTIEW